MIATARVTRGGRASCRSTLVDLLLLTAQSDTDAVVPALSLLAHTVHLAAPQPSSLMEPGPVNVDVALIDTSANLSDARDLCRSLSLTGVSVPVVAIVQEGALVTISAEWGADDIALPTIGPAELDTRLRLLAGRHHKTADQEAPSETRLGDLVIDDGTYTATLRGRPLDLTYREFGLLLCLAQHAGQVLTRRQLLQEVWGFDFFGGTRTVDVHVRRLRAKLGPEHESLIGTVRNVGYRAVP